MLKKIFSLTAAALLLFACTDDEWPAQPDWSQIPNPDEEVDDGLLKPAACTNNIVAHRGGATECKAPDNSLASLRYAIGQGCYGSECDIYWTKDDNVVVAHADGQCKINGMHPWEHTLAELRAGGGLSNGEQLPSLEDFLGEVMKEGCPTRLWLDIKNITYPSTLTEYAINAARRSCEIATEMGAKHFVEFICTGNTTVMKSAFAYAGAAGHTDRLDEQPPGQRIRRTGVFLGQPLGGELHVGRGGRQGYADARRVRKGGRGAERLQRRPAGGRRQRRLYDRSGRLLLLGGRTFQGALHELSRMADRKGRGRDEGLRRHSAPRPTCGPSRPKWRSIPRPNVSKTRRARSSCHTDIAVSEAWTPIAGFAGVFDGNGQDAHGELFGQRRTGGNLRHARRYGEEPAGGRLVHDDRDGQGDAGCRRRQAGREGADRGLYEYGRHRDERRCERYDRDRRNLRSGSCRQRHRGQYQRGADHRPPQDAGRRCGRGRCRRLGLLGRYGLRQQGRDPLLGRGVGSQGRLCGRAYWAGSISAKGYVVEDCRNEAPVTLATAQAANNLLGGIAAYANGENRDTPNTNPQLRESGRRSGRCPRVGQGEDRSGPHGRYLRRYGGLRGEYQLRQGRGPGRRQGRVGVSRSAVSAA